MQMTNADLAALLNAKLGLTGAEAVTANVVRQWVAWDVLPKARIRGRISGKGPVWFRSDAAMHRAMRLGELRERGIRREKAVIVQAYIEWGHSDFDRVKEALLSEWAKWAAQLSRRQITFLGNSEFREVSATKQKAIATQLGPLDARFKGTQFEQSPELYAVFAEITRRDASHLEYIEMLIAGAFRQMMPEAAKNLPQDCMGVLANSIAGMTGTPDEIANSADHTIRNSTKRQFRIARHLIRILLGELRKGEQHGQSVALAPNAHQLWQMLRLLAPQISTGPWLTFLFVQALKITFPIQRNWPNNP